MRTVTDVERWEISGHELLYRSNVFVVVSSLKFERIHDQIYSKILQESKYTPSVNIDSAPQISATVAIEARKGEMKWRLA